MKITEQSGTSMTVANWQQAPVVISLFLGLAIISFLASKRPADGSAGFFLFILAASIAFALLFLLLGYSETVVIDKQAGTIMLRKKHTFGIAPSSNQLFISQLSDVSYDYGAGRGGVYCTVSLTPLTGKVINLESRVHTAKGIKGFFTGSYREKDVAKQLATFLGKPITMKKHGRATNEQ